VDVAKGSVPSEVLLIGVMALGGFELFMGFFDICLPKMRVLQVIL